MRLAAPDVLLAVVVTAATVAGTASSAAPLPTPSTVVRAFYTHHFAHDMAFTEQSVRAKSAWLAPDLLALCLTYLKKPTSPDEVPDIEGDPFTDSQEYPKSFRVGKPRTSGSTVEIPVVFAWPGGRKRTITVQLVQVEGLWRVSNLTYDEGRSFRELLKSGS